MLSSSGKLFIPSFKIIRPCQTRDRRTDKHMQLVTTEV